MPILVCLGSPLLDILANVGTEFLAKYGLEHNGAVLIDQQNIDTFMPIFDEILSLDNLIFLPGGSALNTVRVFQWILNGINGTDNKSDRAVFFGSIGSDREGEMLFQRTVETGVDAKFQQIGMTGTGKCISLINGTNRSLCASLGAASHFSSDFLHFPENAKLIDCAQCFYSTAHFFAVCPEAISHLATKANQLGRPFLLNLGAEYIPSKFRRELDDVMPFVDILFANETEAFAYAKANELSSKNDLHKIAILLTQIKKGRIVLITRGEKPLILAQNGKTKEFPVIFVEKIVDTNGAGDAFCGGFLAAFVDEFSLEKCVQYALSAAATIVKKCGCTFPEEWDGRMFEAEKMINDQLGN